MLLLRRRLIVYAALLVLLNQLLVAGGVIWGAFALSSNFPGIFLEISPRSQDIQAGGSATFDLTAIPFGNWESGDISFVLVDPPRWVTATFDPAERLNASAESFISRLTVRAAADTPPGKMTLTVQGSGVAYWNGTAYHGPLNAEVNVDLNVIAPPVKTITVTTETTQIQTVTLTLTSTTTATSIKPITEPFTYAWAISSIVAAIILAVITLKQKS